MAHYFLFILNFIKNERKGFVTVANIRINYLQYLGTQVHASDTGPDGIWLDSIIRRNTTGIRVAESDPILRVRFFLLDFVGQSDEI